MEKEDKLWRWIEETLGIEMEKRGPLGIPLFGIRKLLAKWKPIVPRPKVFENPGSPVIPAEIARKITFEDLVAILKESPHAKGYAREICSKVCGFEIDSPEFSRCFENAREYMARKLAEKMMI